MSKSSDLALILGAQICGRGGGENAISGDQEFS